MDLQRTVDAIVKGVSALPALAGLPVVAEDKGDVVKNVQAEIAKTSFCVVVGAAEFRDEAPDARACYGTAKVVVTVFEKPVVNRSTPGRPTFMSAAQSIARGMKLFDTGEGLLVTKSISLPQDLGAGVVSCEVAFEVKTTL